MNAETLFEEALEKPRAERNAFLEQACANRPNVRAAVESLLAIHDKASQVPAQPATSPDATVVSAGGQAHSLATGDYTPPPDDSSLFQLKHTAFQTPTEPSLIIAGRYTLLEKIGEGGMGEVWSAQQTEPVKRKVALKLIRLGMDTRAVLQRFEQERQALALMDHPNIAKVLDAGTTGGKDEGRKKEEQGGISSDSSFIPHPSSFPGGGRPFFVMELVDGLPLTRFCDEAKLGIRERLELFAPICHAVQHAHQKGIIHRDLKPSNILVTVIDGRPAPKVIDFGVAKATSSRLTDDSLSTQLGAVVGTLEYMSPEQAGQTAEDVDTRADIYSLGVILYELLTGLRPLDAKRLKTAALHEMIRLIKEEEPSKPSTRLSTDDAAPSLAAQRHTEPKKLAALLRGELDWIVMKCLEKQRDRRYETANGLARDIQRYLANEVVEARPPSASYRLRKFVSRNKGRVLAGGLVLLALLAGIAGTTWGLIREARANASLAVKNAELADEQAKVQARFELAQKAIATFHTGVSEDVLLKNERFKELRTRLLKEAARFYGDLEKLLEGQVDAKSRLLLAQGYVQLGALTEKIGSQTEAVAVLQKALAVRRELAASPDATLESRLDVARILWEIGRLLLAMGDVSAAQKAYQEQLRLVIALDTESPNDAERVVLARCHHSIGVLLSQTGKPKEALEEYRASLAIRQKLTDASPSDTLFQNELAQCHNNMGLLLTQMGEPAKALEELRQALTVRQKLAKANPTVISFQKNLAYNLNSFAGVLSQTGKPVEALANYQNALAIWQGLAETNPAVIEFQIALAWGHNFIGQMLAQTGKAGEALEMHRHALAMEEKLADTNPTVIDIQVDLAQSHFQIGELLAQAGKSAEALEEYRRALAVRQKLADATPTFTSFQSLLAASHNTLSKMLAQTGKPEEALEEYRRALAIQQRLANAAPADTQLQSGLTSSYDALGTMLAQTGKFPEALEEYQKSLTIRQKLTAANPAVAQYQNDLSWSHGAVGEVLLKMGKRSESLEAYRRSLTIRQKLVGANPANTQFQSDLAWSLQNFGDLLSQAGRWDEAESSYSQSLKVHEKLAATNVKASEPPPELPVILASLGKMQRRAGRLAEAAASLRRAAANVDRIKALTVENQYNQACIYALLAGVAGEAGSGMTRAESQAAADRAMDALRRTIAAGFGDGAQLRADADLEALRPRADFKKLVAELEKKPTVNSEKRQ